MRIDVASMCTKWDGVLLAGQPPLNTSQMKTSTEKLSRSSLLRQLALLAEAREYKQQVGITAIRGKRSQTGAGKYMLQYVGETDEEDDRDADVAPPSKRNRKDAGKSSSGVDHSHEEEDLEAVREANFKLEMKVHTVASNAFFLALNR